MSNIRIDLRQDQGGMASILVTMILMIVITLIVLGFVKVAGRDQREALDNQLMTQAYYAAESGINDVVTYLQTNSPAQTVTKTSCQAPGSSTNPWFNFYQDYQQSLDSISGSSTSITCLLVNPTPTVLTKQFSDPGESWVTPLYGSSSGSTIKSLTFTLYPPNGVSPNASMCNSDFQQNSTNPGLYQLPTSSGARSCGYAAVRLDLVRIGQLTAAGEPTVTPNELLQNTMSMLLVPQSSGGSIGGFIPNGTSSTTTDTYPMQCDANNCTETIMINLPPNYNEYYLRAMLLYNSGTLTVTGQKTGAGSSVGPVAWRDGQVLIDSTGKDQDEIKRIQEALPINNALATPNFAVQSTQSVCKYFTIVPGQSPNQADPTNCS